MNNWTKFLSLHPFLVAFNNIKRFWITYDSLFNNDYIVAMWSEAEARNVIQSAYASRPSWVPTVLAVARTSDNDYWFLALDTTHHVASDEVLYWYLDISASKRLQAINPQK
jgi:hypothetical protein